MANLTKPVKIIGLLFLFGLFPVVNSQGQNTLPFQNYTVNEGLPSSEVYHVMQDSKGFMWFSTDHGVCRYDGYQFKTFTTADGLADNTIFECSEDYKGRIWFRSYSGKLSYYFHDSMFQLPENEKLVSLLHQSLITSFVIDSSDNIYIATQLLQGIIRIDLKRKNSVEWIPLPIQVNYLVMVSGAGQPIIGSSLKKRRLEIDTNSIFVVYAISSRDSTPIRQYQIPLKRPPKIPMVHTQAIRLPDNEIVFSFGEKLVVLQNKKIIFQYTFSSIINKLNWDKTGKIWIAFENNNPQYYYKGILHQIPVSNLLTDKKITSSITDNEGGLWLTSLKNGIYYLSSLDFVIRTEENGLPGNKINELEMAPDSSLWVATSPCNIITVIGNDTILHYTINNVDKATTINSIVFGKDHSIWLSSGVGVFVYNASDFPNRLQATFDRGVKDMVQAMDSSVWVNCTGNVVLFKKQHDSLVIQKLVYGNTVIKKMLVSRDLLWLATMGGLYKYSHDSLFNLGDKYPVLKQRIDDLKLSPNGDLWLATRDTGLIILNKNKLIYINFRNGLVSNFSHCLTFDYKGNMWVGTNTGLSHIFTHHDKENNCIIDSIKNIVSPNLKEINCITCIKNTVYAGTNNGLVSFDMNKMNINKVPPPVYISGLKINNKDITLDIPNLKLSYDENNIVINYVGLTYRDPSNTLYRYKMEGIDTGWIYTRYTVVQYPKLPPGEYSFLVSARNSDGVWSKTNATASFIITPPVWAIWWVKWLASVILILLVYWRIRLILKRERVKAEANQKLTEMELRELREQMDPHFLFNNLNTLSYLVESKSPDAPVFVEELSKYFRYSLQFRNVEFTELKNELKQAERYIHLLRIRYGDKLIVQWDINENLSGYFISNHSLQLLLENIIKHIVVSVESPLFIQIKTTDTNSLYVKNNLQPKIGVEESTGLGLKSIDERYYLLYKRNIKIFRTSDSFIVELPLLTPYEYESANY